MVGQIFQNLRINMTEKEKYNKLLKSGMFFEFYPDLTGNWEKDETKFKIINQSINEQKKQNKRRSIRISKKS